MRALLGSTHPGPAAAVTVIAVVLGIGVGLDPWRLVLLGVAVALNQASVGLSNDAIDAERDRAVGRRDKPIARGDIGVRTVWTAAVVTATLSVLLTISLGIGATFAHAVFIASAWAYNLGLKSTVASVVPYIVSFGILPTVITLARPVPVVAPIWAMALGALLGVAAHIANVLPDLDDDRRTGVRGFPHRIGVRAAGVVTWLALGAAAVLGFAGATAGAGGVGILPIAALVANTVIAVVGIVLVLTRPPSRVLFRLIISAALVDVVLLATSGLV